MIKRMMEIQNTILNQRFCYIFFINNCASFQLFLNDKASFMNYH